MRIRRKLGYDFGRLARVVAADGLSYAQVASIVGVGRNEVYKVLKGKGSADTAACIVEAVNAVRAKRAKETSLPVELLNWREFLLLSPDCLQNFP